MCVVLVLNINDNYTLRIMLKIITRCININIILLQKKQKKKNPVVLASVTFHGAGFEPGTFELPIVTYLTI